MFILLVFWYTQTCVITAESRHSWYGVVVCSRLVDIYWWFGGSLEFTGSKDCTGNRGLGAWYHNDVWHDHVNLAAYALIYAILYSCFTIVSTWLIKRLWGEGNLTSSIPGEHDYSYFWDSPSWQEASLALWWVSTIVNDIICCWSGEIGCFDYKVHLQWNSRFQ